jgi:hypothetical protein
MSAIIAYCGLTCHTCPIYMATREDNPTEQKRMRVEIARQCQEQYRIEYSPVDITDCDGCPTAGGRLFSGCSNCLIRECAMQRGYENCAWCSEYVCDKLEKLFVSEPSARKRLDEIRNSNV